MSLMSFLIALVKYSVLGASNSIGLCVVNNHLFQEFSDEPLGDRDLSSWGTSQSKCMFLSTFTLISRNCSLAIRETNNISMKGWTVRRCLELHCTAVSPLKIPGISVESLKESGITRWSLESRGRKYDFVVFPLKPRPWNLKHKSPTYEMVAT